MTTSCGMVNGRQYTRFWSAKGTKAIVTLGCVYLLILFSRENFPSTRYSLGIDYREGTTCDRLWEQRQASHENYVSMLQDHESAEDGGMDVWNGTKIYDAYKVEWICDLDMRHDATEYMIPGIGSHVCGAHLLREMNDCLIYSLGSDTDLSFENHIHSYAQNCEIHVFNRVANLTNSVILDGPKENQILVHSWNAEVQRSINDINGRTLTSLQDIVSSLDHLGRTIHVLKLDCEGCEYDVIPQVIDMIRHKQIRIEQIQIKIHGTDAVKIQRVFKTMRHAGFVVFHKEHNDVGCDCGKYAFMSMEKAKEIFYGANCDKEERTSLKKHDRASHEKFLFYSTRNDGFNNQMDNVRVAICAAYRSGRTLVLFPLWYDWDWNHQNTSAFLKFGDFFDTPTLSKLISVIELDDFRRLGREADIDVQCNDGGPKEEILNISTYSKAKHCEDGILYSDIPVISVYDNLWNMCGWYGLPHPHRRGNLVTPGTMHWLVSKHLTFSSTIQSYVSSIKKHFRGSGFIALHVRLGDYKNHHCKHVSFCPSVSQIITCLTKMKLTQVFIATNPSDIDELLDELRNSSSDGLSFFDSSLVHIPSELTSAVEQALCIESDIFIGSNTSSWSQFVFDSREVRGIQKSLTWNQCLDV